MLDITYGAGATMPRLAWGDWNPRPPYRAWDRCLELRRAETPFGAYLLLRRSGMFRRESPLLTGKWFVERPAAPPLGPFDDDVQAARAAQADFTKRASELRVREPEIDRLREENAKLRAENARLGLALHHAINSPKGVVPAGFEDFYEAEKADD